MKVKTEHIFSCLGNRFHLLVCKWDEEQVERRKGRQQDKRLTGFLLPADHLPRLTLGASSGFSELLLHVGASGSSPTLQSVEETHQRTWRRGCKGKELAETFRVTSNGLLTCMFLAKPLETDRMKERTDRQTADARDAVDNCCSVLLQGWLSRGSGMAWGAVWRTTQLPHADEAA